MPKSVNSNFSCDWRDIFVWNPRCGGDTFHDAPSTTQVQPRQAKCEKWSGGGQTERQFWSSAEKNLDKSRDEYIKRTVPCEVSRGMSFYLSLRRTSAKNIDCNSRNEAVWHRCPQMLRQWTRNPFISCTVTWLTFLRSLSRGNLSSPWVFLNL